MEAASWWLSVCVVGVLAGGGGGISPCMHGSIINVILLDDEWSPWSLKYVKGEVLKAIEKDKALNSEGVQLNLTANFGGFNTTFYGHQGCTSTTCEGVEELKYLMHEGDIGCSVLGPTCTYAAFQIVDMEKGLKLSTPIISAGSFGLTCDSTSNLQRLLPPARKISSFFIQFWPHTNGLKPQWNSTYLLKKDVNTEDCFWYVNALDAGFFAKTVHRNLVHTYKELNEILTSQKRSSNLFIMCGSPLDLLEAKNGSKEADSSEILFLLIDLYNDQYYTNTSSMASMQNVLVLTMPNTRNYTINPDIHSNSMMNDYMAAYHDAVLLIGQVMRKIMEKNASEVQAMEFVNVNYFRNTSFNGSAGTYKLDSHGDRDVELSIIYTTPDHKYRLLFSFDTETNVTTVIDHDPVFIWGKRLPDYRPGSDSTSHNIILIVLGVTVVVVTTIAFIFYRQNRRDHQMRKRWSHIAPDLIQLLENDTHNVVSLKIEDEGKKSNFNIQRAFYDRKIVILKELKHSDGNFNETQKIELNALRQIDYYNLTKFYGTVKLEQGVFGVFEYGERGSLRYVLNDLVSYPEETFMDWEFKISVMYDIAKGMSYLHASDIQVHGRLKSTNCVVDNRMVVKITDFGCNSFLSPGKDLWTAPEHLKEQGTSQKGDVYSFAIIAHEIVLRKCTFYTASCTGREEKLSRIITSNLRPDLNSDTDSEKELEVYTLIKSCWDEDPEKRPDFRKVENSLGKIISKIHNQENESYVDNMIRRLQMYSRNLEHLVEERTALYKAERDRADNLNFMLLPRPVVKSLKESGMVEPELYEEVTIYFSDIVGFTTLCQYSTPMEVVDMLNDIYKGFDSIVDLHDVYKVLPRATVRETRRLRTHYLQTGREPAETGGLDSGRWEHHRLLRLRAGGDHRGRLHGGLRTPQAKREQARRGHLPHGAGHPALHGHLPAETPARHPRLDPHRRPLRFVRSRSGGGEDAQVLPVWRHGQHGVSHGVHRTPPADPRERAHHQHPAEDRLQVRVRDPRGHLSEGQRHRDHLLVDRGGGRRLQAADATHDGEFPAAPAGPRPHDPGVSGAARSRLHPEEEARLQPQQGGR